MKSHEGLQRGIYDRHYPKRAAVVREQLAHPLFSSFNDRLAARILDLAPEGAGGRPLRILEVGCGEGLLAASLERVAAQRGTDLAYTGADLSPEALELARRSAPGGSWAEGGAEEVLAAEAESSHDIVIAKNLLHHVDDPAGLLAQAARAVGPSGRVVAVEARLGCPQFWVFGAFAPRRERFFFSGQRRNLGAMAAAGLRVVHTERFSWLPYELAFHIRFKVFRRLLSFDDRSRIDAVSRLDDRLAKSPLGVTASYVIWAAERDGSKST